MSVTVRVFSWLLTGTLLCGGCAVSDLVSSESSGTLEQLAENGSPEDQMAARQAAPASEMSPAVVAEAALIREKALQSGYSQARAEELGKSFLRMSPTDRKLMTPVIYGALNRANVTPDVSNEAGDESPADDRAVELSAHAAATAAGRNASPSNTKTSRASRNSRKPGLDEVNPAARVTATLQAAVSPQGNSPGKNAASGQLVAERGNVSDVGDRQPQGNAKHSKQRHAGSEASELPGEPVGSATQPAAAENPPRKEEPSAEQNDESEVSSAKTPSDVAESVSMPTESKAAEIGEKVELALHHAPAGSRQAGSAESKEDVTWQRSLRRTISRLREELADREFLDPQEEARLRASLSLLELAAEDRQQAMDVLEGLDQQQLEFWRQTIMGLSILLDPAELPKLRYRVESTSEHMENGLASLAMLGPLQVNSLAFVSNVRSFGDYDEIDSYAFEPGEPVILYVEIENFTVEEVSADRSANRAPGRRRSSPVSPIYETELHGRYDILDENQRIVVSRTLPVNRDRCRQHRRDYFIPYPLYIPKNLKAGYYTLELTVEDKKGERFGAGVLDFRIR